MSRNKTILTLIVTIFMITLLTSGLAAVKADSTLDYEGWVQRFSSLDYRQVFALDSEPLELPQSDLKEFSEEGQDKLFDLASRFGEEELEKDEFKEITNNSLLINSQRTGFSFAGDEILEVDRNSLNNRLNLSADFREDLSEDGEDDLKSAADLALEYNLGDRATLRAGYGERVFALQSEELVQEEEEQLASLAVEDGEEELSSQSLADNEDFSEEDSFSAENFQDEFSEAAIVDNREENTADNQPRTQYVEEDREADMVVNPGQLGLTIKPFDNLSFSADYHQQDVFSSSSQDYTVLGLEYQDSLGNLRASYQFDSLSESRQSISGLEVDFLDLATLSASYKLLDLDELEDTLQTEWDLGLDLNVSDFSSLSFGYQMVDSLPDLVNEDSEGQESSISASFEIRF